ncbi:MAG: hypothetical protein Q8M24_18930 [Pseudolabrys sp.]|nr:hypothetical protein [Pseudolabrys sp.]MDP2297521.1 hypothetical protein [Pseudolabrys sp.]
MHRTQIVVLLALAAAVPGATAASYFSLGGKPAAAKPCFVAGNAGYQLSAAANARHIVRIDNDAALPHLRMQLVDDPAAAEFVLVDDNDATLACTGVSTVESIRIDAGAAKPDLVVAVSRAPADYKIYLRSKNFDEQDAAALAAVIWQNAGRTGSLRTVAR